MTITQANAVNVLVERILRAPLEFEHCLVAISDLVTPANKALSAGYSETSFREAMYKALKKAHGRKAATP